eukprot:GHVT01089496.1.p2 GENE.GHVT01089496.1~~GHVT01089496.1.p2  ORF type:complete len:105 (+),score=17.35 GHVT01089496.1:532-846(+)
MNFPSFLPTRSLCHLVLLGSLWLSAGSLAFATTTRRLAVPLGALFFQNFCGLALLDLWHTRGEAPVWVRWVGMPGLARVRPCSTAHSSTRAFRLVPAGALKIAE